MLQYFFNIISPKFDMMSEKWTACYAYLEINLQAKKNLFIQVTGGICFATLCQRSKSVTGLAIKMGNFNVNL